MEQILVFLLLCCIMLIIILWVIGRKKQDKIDYAEIELKLLKNLKKDDLKQYFREEWNEEEKRFGLKKKSLLQEYEQDKREVDLKLHNLETILKEKEKRYEEVNQDLNLYKEGKIKEIDGVAAEYEQRKQLEIKQKLQKMEFQANSDFNNHVDSYTIQKAQMQCEIKEIKAELEIERSKRAAINEEILRQKKLEEQQDFYRIQLSPNDKDDVEILRSVAPRLRHPEAINKVIWSGYYQKPLAELRKRLLPNGDVSCVYKATRLKTGEIYIGQTTSFDKRLQEHTRSALGIGTLASSQLHRKMLEDGPENYTWEILEEVSKDKLRERESYYIDFYDSKTYGLNTVSGDKNK